MSYAAPAFFVPAQIHKFFIDDSRTGNCKLLRCATEYPKKRGAAKAEVMFRYVGPLVPNSEVSRKLAFEHAERFANLYPSQIVTFESTVFLAGKTVLGFGKYAGKTLDDVKAIKPDYIEWLAKNMTPRNHIDQRIVLQCKAWLYSGATKRLAS